MGGAVAAIGAATGGLGGFGSILGSVLSMAMQPSAPSPTPPPPAPAPAPAPAAPEVSTAADVSEEPVIDTEAAKLRAQKRRKAAEDENLFSLTPDTSEVAKKSLLGS